MKKQPKYEMIKNNLIELIETGVYPPASELPSENELIARYEASRITVRRAIDELYHAGYIEKHQGKRGYVRQTAKVQELNTISSYTEEILRQGMVPSRKLLCSELRLGTLAEQAELQLDKTAPVFHMERIVFADNKPLCYTSTTLPYVYFRDIENYDFEQNSLYEVIEHRYNVRISTSALKLKAVPAGKEIAEYLDIDLNTPLLYSSAITYGIINGAEVPIESFSTYYLTDFFEYTLIQKRNSAQP